jgi:hypothetical protein
MKVEKMNTKQGERTFVSVKAIAMHVVMIGLALLAASHAKGQAMRGSRIQKELAAEIDPAEFKDEQLIISGDGLQCAYYNGKDMVTFDGKAGKTFDEIRTPLIYSEEGPGIACIGRRDGREYIVLDGKEFGPYERVEMARFSRDGKRFGFIAHEDSGNCSLVIDGKKHREGTRSMFELVFSPNGDRFAYQLQDVGSITVVVDGEPGLPFEIVGRVVFSRDGKHVAYPVKDSGLCFWVIDGKVQEKFETYNPTSFRFSPDGSRHAYTVKDGLNWYAIVDKQKYGPFVAVANEAFQFSPDSKHFALAARDRDGSFAWHDGEGGPRSPFILAGTPVFSPDGKKWVYASQISPGVLGIRVNGELAWKVPGLVNYYFVYGPKGKKLVYCVVREGKFAMAVNGKEGKLYVDAFKPIFSPDGRKLAYPAYRTKTRATVVVNGKEGKWYDQVCSQTLMFLPRNRLVYGVRIKRKFHVVTRNRPGPGFDMIYIRDRLQFPVVEKTKIVYYAREFDKIYRVTQDATK